MQIRRIIQLTSHWRSNREIAHEVHVARYTVNEYIRHLIDKVDSLLMSANFLYVQLSSANY